MDNLAKAFVIFFIIIIIGLLILCGGTIIDNQKPAFEIDRLIINVNYVNTFFISQTILFLEYNEIIKVDGLYKDVKAGETSTLIYYNDGSWGIKE